MIRCTKARVAGSVASGVRSSSVGTSTLPLTWPLFRVWLPLSVSAAPFHAGIPTVTP